MAYALIVDGTVREVFAEDPDLHASLRVEEVSSSVQEGWVEQGPSNFAPASVNSTPEANIAEARRRLNASDVVAVRCLKVGVEYPGPWRDYDAATRSIAASGVVPDAGWPSRPDYPAGS